MSSSLIALTGAIYLFVSFDQFRRANLPMGVAYLGYAFANLGLFFLAK